MDLHWLVCSGVVFSTLIDSRRRIGCYQGYSLLHRATYNSHRGGGASALLPSIFNPRPCLTLASVYLTVSGNCFLHNHPRNLKMNKSLVLAAIVASVALVACGKKEEAAVPAPAPMAAPAAVEAASAAAGAASVAAGAAMDAASAASSAAVSTGAAASAAVGAAADAAQSAGDAAMKAAEAAKDAMKK